MSYTADEAALTSLIATKMTGYSANNTKAGDQDAMFTYILANGGNGCVVDYSGGDNDGQSSPFGNNANWIWSCVVTFFIPYDVSTIETDIRTAVDDFMELYRDNKRLSTGAVWRIQAARAYEIYKVSERSYVPVSFLVNIKSPI